MERADGCRGGEVVGGDLGDERGDETIRHGLWGGRKCSMDLGTTGMMVSVWEFGVNGLKSREYMYIYISKLSGYHSEIPH